MSSTAEQESQGHVQWASPRASNQNSPCLSFFICKMGPVAPSSLGYWKDSIANLCADLSPAYLVPSEHLGSMCCYEPTISLRLNVVCRWTARGCGCTGYVRSTQLSAQGRGAGKPNTPMTCGPAHPDCSTCPLSTTKATPLVTPRHGRSYSHYTEKATEAQSGLLCFMLMKQLLCRGCCKR